jgi:hypothetical protein
VYQKDVASLESIFRVSITLKDNTSLQELSIALQYDYSYLSFSNYELLPFKKNASNNISSISKFNLGNSITSSNGVVSIILSDDYLITNDEIKLLDLIFTFQDGVCNSSSSTEVKITQATLITDLEGSELDLLADSKDLLFNFFNQNRLSIYGSDSFTTFLKSGGFTNIILLVGISLGALLIILIIFSIILLLVRPGSNVKSKREFDSQLGLIKRRIEDLSIEIPTPDRFALTGIPKMELLPVVKERTQTKVNFATSISSVTLITGEGSKGTKKNFEAKTTDGQE